MKHLTVIAAGLGHGTLERARMLEIAGLKFESAQSVFPAVTCVAQATLRTGQTPAEHGILSNGWWSNDLQKPLFWEQSAKIVKGPRIWDGRRASGGTVGLFFMQQSLGESADVIVSPAPIHKHGGGMSMSCYTKPSGMAPVLEKLCGKFPLWRYWGPLASPKIGRMCISWFEAMTNMHDVDEAYLYLPTLDYAAQAHGPGSSASRSALKEFRRQLERVADICMRRACELSVVGDYSITEVTAEPQRPNITLRKNGLFRTRTVAGRAYPDLYQSDAFAICDHEVCVLVGEKREEAARLLLSEGEYGRVTGDDIGDNVILTANPGSWCEYVWWDDRREAPDFAAHVDIHSKPGFDPKELFFFCRGAVRGTHGRRCAIARTGSGL